MAVIKTFTGKLVDPLDLQPNDICIEDIARSLSQQCRWTGHCKHHYSVAQHSYYCSLIGGFESIYDTNTMKWCLMHDASEAYIGDIARPMKALCKPLVSAEYEIQARIGKEFGLAWPMPAIVDKVDDMMLVTEAIQLTNTTREEINNRWSIKCDDCKWIKLDQIGPEQAYKIFMDRFSELWK